MPRSIAIVMGLAVALTTALCGSAAAQTTQSASPTTSWNDALHQLADAVRGKDLNALVAMLDHGPVIRNFSSDAIQAPERLLGAATGARLLGVHAYVKAPTTLATDLAANFQNAPNLPDAIRQRMTPPDDGAAKRANETAGQWMSQVLQPAKDQPVGVIVLWREERADTFGAPRTYPIFLLVKAQLLDGQYVVRQVTFGDPLEAAR